VNIDLNCENYRIFGYNSPDPDSGQMEYGYEVCVTIPDHLKVADDKIKVKTLEGGLFAVTAINREKDKDIGDSIILGWQRFTKWLEGSKYAYGGRQYLEEHLGFDEEDKHIGGVDLYMPIWYK
jgi:AraC family transcriptional regulator